MGLLINNDGNRSNYFMNDELMDIVKLFPLLFRVADEDDEEEIQDDEIPFCDMPCKDCPECDQLDDYDIVDEDEYDELWEGEDIPFWGIPDVRRVVFNDPATIVFWDDGTKTVVKCMKGEKFERYAGFAMACMKKMFGSTSRAKAIMNECDTENMKHWQEEALKPKAQSETKSEPKVNKYEPKYKPLDYGPFVETLEKFMHTFDNIEDRMKEEKKDETPAE